MELSALDALASTGCVVSLPHKAGMQSSFPMLKKNYKYYEVPEGDCWRLPLLTSLMTERQEMDACGEGTETISGLIDSLCYS